MCVAVALVTAVFGVMSASAKPRPGRARAVNLFSSAVAVMNVNRLLCPITNTGEVCVDSTLSPVLEGGFWPKGTPDSYIFNSGLQLGGVIPANAGFPWAGDTVGAFFMDPRGDQAEGEGITQIYNSLSPVDAGPGGWPNGAYVRDTAIFNSVLINRAGQGAVARDGSGISISQEDLWVRVWDGNPVFTGSARTHPMGIMVEERGMAWNFPTGNQDIVYFVYTFYNVSASDCAKYQNATIDPAVQQEVCDVGKRFQALNEAKYGLQIPDGGYAISNLFAAFFEDCDVGDASKNYSTPDVVFNLGFCYKSDFLEPNWSFPLEAFSPAPLVVAPGFTGVKYLKSPVGNNGKELGLTLFSNTLNSALGYPDPVGVHQMYRYLSGTNPAAGDNPCSLSAGGTTPDSAALKRHWCFLFQQPVDTRFFMSSGPFTLNAGEARTIVVAYLQAAATSDVNPFIGASGNGLQPGFPGSAAGLVAHPESVRVIDKATGWLSATDANVNGVIDQEEVKSVPGSMLNKALVAQAVFDAKFLLPFAPDPPNFFLVPGNNQVTIAWQPSTSERTGDPFFVVAADRTSPLYDPNFRQLDVEGYRIYRGRTTGDLQLIAQFDYAGTVITDYTGGFEYPGNCAPELGVQTDCPVTFDANPVVPTSPHVDHPVIGPVVQIPVGGRVKLADGSILILRADTAVVGGKSGFLPLSDTGVPFTFVDRGARNSFTYFYAVTAFDLNSLRSGPTSLESPRITKQVTPRKPSGQETTGSITTPVLLSSRGDTLNPTAADPTVDANTGILSGPEPPTNGFQTSLAVFVPQLLASGSVVVTLDSVKPGNAPTFGLPAAPALYYLTSVGPTGATKAVIPLNVDGTNSDSTTTRYAPVTGVDKTKVGRFGGDSSFAMYASLTVSSPGTWRTESYGRASANSDPANSPENGPRWWAGTANENTSSPNSAVCAPASGCIDAVFNSRTNVKTAGALPGVSLLLHVTSYLTVPNPMRTLEPVLASVTRAADFKVYWKASGGIDSVVDVTHKMPVPFGATIGTGWGFLNDLSFAGVPAASTPDLNNAVLSWSDVFCVDPAPAFTLQCGSGATAGAVLMNQARLSPIADTSVAFTASPPATGNGFTFYIAGHFFLMQMTRCGACELTRGT
ncbi:MAG: hypothetical protein E6I87_14590 [Chloroflexi bacterium]|nr:MAG: hypothetical protein E6I87_14590 [Chloroflexota bacterium]